MNWRHLRRQLVSFIGSKDIAHGMYCGFPSPLLTSAHLHGPTSIDHILFCNSSDAFAIILLITSPTLIGRTLPLHLSGGIRQVAKIDSMVSGSSVSIRFSSGVVQKHLLWFSIIFFSVVLAAVTDLDVASVEIFLSL